MNGPIYRLPGEPRSGDAALNRWGAEVNRALAALRHPVEGPRVLPVMTPRGSHPWKVTDAGSGSIAIAAGYILGYFMTLSTTAASLDVGHSWTPPLLTDPSSIVMGPGGAYAGGTEAVTGTKYVYAEIPRNGEPGTGDDEYAESADIFEDSHNHDGGGYAGEDHLVAVELTDAIHPALTAGVPATATIVISSSAPDAYGPTTGKAAVCIAKVTNTAGVIAVDDQFVTSNPPIFIPVIALFDGA